MRWPLKYVPQWTFNNDVSTRNHWGPQNSLQDNLYCYGTPDIYLEKSGGYAIWFERKLWQMGSIYYMIAVHDQRVFHTWPFEQYVFVKTVMVLPPHTAIAVSQWLAKNPTVQGVIVTEHIGRIFISVSSVHSTVNTIIIGEILRAVKDGEESGEKVRLNIIDRVKKFLPSLSYSIIGENLITTLI